jgi:hypothetical protein
MGLPTLKHLQMLEQSKNMLANVVLNAMNN